ncbi:MAG: TIGR00159 family protein [Acidobacteriia bacterium]|nr:TIGR00159 family protein [Terriglobia bacterium]
MNFLTAPLFPSLPKLTPIALLDVLVTAFLIYQFLVIIRGRRAANILSGVFVLIGIYLASLYAGLEMLPTLLATIAPYTAFALIVMFQSEIRRMLARIGKRGWMGWGNRLKRREFIEEILLALDQLSRTRTGALIVLERDIGLRTFVESGVVLEAAVSRDLLLAIFHPGAALHDGAVIIQGEKIAAAACFLPLSMNPALMSTLGTRHRAGIGITEETDCLSLVVSEETGRISIASFGEIEGDVTLEKVGLRLSAHLGGAERHRLPAGPGAGPETAPGMTDEERESRLEAPERY